RPSLAASCIAPVAETTLRRKTILSRLHQLWRIRLRVDCLGPALRSRTLSVACRPLRRRETAGCRQSDCKSSDDRIHLRAHGNLLPLLKTKRELFSRRIHVLAIFASDDVGGGRV